MSEKHGRHRPCRAVADLSAYLQVSQYIKITNSGNTVSYFIAVLQREDLVCRNSCQLQEGHSLPRV